MIKSLTNDLCIMADALMANGILGYGTAFTPDFTEKYKTLQVYGIDSVKKHGESFYIQYESCDHIQFCTNYSDYVIFTLISYPKYQEWMLQHPDTTVVDWTKGKDKHANVLRRQTDGV